ncbi:FYVE zinc finger-domain-containing protein [Polychytrium aggregatum]|uniref:FYVE zinc finger-domain-containing protein n=1 Tax=Polychytrium aggregatum TaxID=110093 RepID=UPI0022FE3E4E|nr:FYVE zinc finger-domain-containing protein [Polychytrium aggregatum]KAI9206389.1 FYVE zinc finger-domain-containing protein [Polychytrium aggregatum]
MPVQRIPRYKLLLEDLLKHTTQWHSDYEPLRQAYGIVLDVASRVNERIRQTEMILKMLEIKKSLIGFNEELIIPGRTLVRTGAVQKVCRKNNQPRRIFLFSDCIILASPTPLEDQLLFHRRLDLEYCTARSPDIEAGSSTDGNLDSTVAFSIISPDKSFTLLCDSPQDRDEWIAAINARAGRTSSIDPGLARGSVRTVVQSEASEQPVTDGTSGHWIAAPVWVPDGDSSICMRCSQPFSFWNRKHHCRLCGRLVCHPCSGKLAVISGYNINNNSSGSGSGSSSSSSSNSPVRVCEDCFASSDARPVIDNGPDASWSGRLGRLTDSVLGIGSKSIVDACSLCEQKFGLVARKTTCDQCARAVCSGCLDRRESANSRSAVCDACSRGIAPNDVVLIPGQGWCTRPGAGTAQPRE